MRKVCHVLTQRCLLDHAVFKLVAERPVRLLLQPLLPAGLPPCRGLRWRRAMALETLRYGSFKPTAVVTEAKSLPGYGGDVQDWTNYKFAVEAIQKKESMLSKEQQEKLGPLGLRLAERLIGPALQVAKKIGIDELSGKDGTKTLLRELEKQLLPLRKQAALELYNAGMRDGVLSRQSGEPMSSYCLRRETWWTMLRDMDPGIQCSDTIVGEQLADGPNGLR